MAHTATKTLGGEFLIEAVLQEEPGPEALERLEARIDRFISALDLGMYPPTQFGTRIPVVDPPNGVRRCFRASQIPEFGFAVLGGMLHRFVETLATLKKSVAWERSNPAKNLLRINIVPPPLPQKLPGHFALALQSQRTTPPLEVTVDFGSGVLDAADRDKYVDEMWVWSELLQGGYTVTEQPGQAATSHIEIRFLQPQRVRLVTHEWWGVSACFVPLLHLLKRWDKRQRVAGATIEVS